MQAVRHLFAQRHLTLMICVAVLVLKLLVPTGYMIGTENGHITVGVCSSDGPRMMTIEIPGLGSDAGMDGKSAEATGLPCAFQSLSAALLDPIDPIQLAALIAFVLALGLIATIPPAPSQPAYLRPPLRGPPAPL